MSTGTGTGTAITSTVSDDAQKLAIVNKALMSIGQQAVSALTVTTSPVVNQVNLILESVIKELSDYDWLFNRSRVTLDKLTKVYRLTVDVAPSGWIPEATITGATSLVTCTIKQVLSSTEYLVTEPSDDFTDGEVLSDGTNTADCGTGYPLIEAPHDHYLYAYVLPSDWLRLRFLSSTYSDKVRYPRDIEGPLLLCNQTDAVLCYNKVLESSSGVSQISLMPLWFHRLVSARLAFILAPNITQDMKQRQKVELEWKDAQLYAHEQNGQSAYHEDEIGNTDWVDGADSMLI